MSAYRIRIAGYLLKDASSCQLCVHCRGAFSAPRPPAPGASVIWDTTGIRNGGSDEGPAPLRSLWVCVWYWYTD